MASSCIDISTIDPAAMMVSDSGMLLQLEKDQDESSVESL